MIRIAAAGDVHFGKDSAGRLSRHWPELAANADVFLLAGDLTQVGTLEEIEALAHDLATCPVPTIAVLGNHDYHANLENEIKGALQAARVRVLDCESTTIEIAGSTLGVYGCKGFGGGFLGASGSDFGEREMKAFIEHTKSISAKLREGLRALKADHKVALLHYSPTADTLMGEKKEIYPFLGSYLLAEAIDDGGADVAFHGHAHKGTEKGATSGGVPVRNVAQPVIRHAFKIYTIHELSARSEAAVGVDAT